MRFSSWPELKEARISGHIEAAFMVAPMALALVEQGVKMKVVYLGHRDGSALMVHKDSTATSFRDLRGKRIAVPNRFSNQYLLIYRGLTDQGMSLKDVEIVEMPPPDMPAALYARAVDAIISGEPFMGQAELDGYGRVLYQAKEIWPDFISCVLVVSDELIQNSPDRVQELVTGIAKSGLWLDTSLENRMAAAETVSRNYYNQDSRLLRFVLSKPPDRVTYSNLALSRPEWERIMNMSLETGLLKAPLAFERYTDTRFSDGAGAPRAYLWKAP